MSDDRKRGLPLSGRFSPLRYPGGKGKLARFVAEVVKRNGLQDGMYVEPYAGGAAVALELLLTGLVRRVHINDLSRPIYAFWIGVLEHTDEFNRMVVDTPLDIETWSRMKRIFGNPNDADDLQLGFATFYLNRTNRSGILNGGPIGGRSQNATWNMDARYNRTDLVARIERISRVSRRITLTNLDARQMLRLHAKNWPERTLIYLDPPYYEKGRELYYNFYRPEDHAGVASAIRGLTNLHWIVSYDDVSPIHDLYLTERWLQYQIGYSARERTTGREAMFFSQRLMVPPVQGSMIELDRWTPAGAAEGYVAPKCSAQEAAL
jgi:DNA adenine methylase